MSSASRAPSGKRPNAPRPFANACNRYGYLGRRAVILTLSLPKEKESQARTHHPNFPATIQTSSQKAKLKRSKTVILSEAEGPAFLSFTRMRVPHVSCLRRGIEKVSTTPNTIFPSAKAPPPATKDKLQIPKWDKKAAFLLPHLNAYGNPICNLLTALYGSGTRNLKD